jgi:hypothetical protein
VIAQGGSIRAPNGLTLDALASTWTAGGILVNQGLTDGGSALSLYAASVSGSGAFLGDTITLATYGNANNPIHGANFLSNGLQLSPSTAGSVALTLNAYGSVPQFLNLMISGNASVAMPSAWPAGFQLPPNNAAVAQGGVRAAGVADPAFGGGSMIVQASGNLSLAGGATNDLAFPGGIVLKAGRTLDVNGVVVNQGWTTSGKSFQGVFFEAPSIANSMGNLQVLSNNLNWVNFSTLPQAHVRTWQLVRAPDGSAQFATADSIAPHLNTYSILIGAAAAGQCWVCLVNGAPVNVR